MKAPGLSSSWPACSGGLRPGWKWRRRLRARAARACPRLARVRRFNLIPRCSTGLDCSGPRYLSLSARLSRSSPSRAACNKTGSATDDESETRMKSYVGEMTAPGRNSVQMFFRANVCRDNDARPRLASIDAKTGRSSGSGLRAEGTPALIGRAIIATRRLAVSLLPMSVAMSTPGGCSAARPPDSMTGRPSERGARKRFAITPRLAFRRTLRPRSEGGAAFRRR